jgi:lipid-A-disaccharide synthase
MMALHRVIILFLTGTEAMRIFLSAGEPSGDLHAANLVRALRARRPHVDCVGFGGDRLASAGCELLYPLCELAVVGFVRVLAHATSFLELVSQADRYFRHQRPDAVVLIDFPGFNWWIARRAHFHGIPVYYFVPPQLWGWAPWRVNKMRRYVDHVLCTLPFEKPWYAERGVAAQYVGHPYFDELREQRLDGEFLQHERNKGGRIVALLPGSRNQEVSRNWPMMAAAAQRIFAECPDVRFVVASYKESQRQRVEAQLRDAKLPIETHVGRTPEIIHLAEACIAVSGSVGLELLWHGTPSAVCYQVSSFDLWLAGKLKTAPYISLVNLLADKELFPEFLTDRSLHVEMAEQVIDWLNDGASLEAVRAELAALRERVAQAGACERTAEYILATLRAKPLAA